MVTLDRDRLLRDLRAGAHELQPLRPGLELTERLHLCGMERAWLVTAAGIEDGEYDQEEAPR